MKMKEGTGWKACHNDERGVYGAEVMFQGSWALYEITGEVFARLSSKLSSGEAERLGVQAGTVWRTCGFRMNGKRNTGGGFPGWE